MHTLLRNNLSRDILDEDDLIFESPQRKKPCQTPAQEIPKDAILKVKFKRDALCYYAKNSILYSMHRKSSTMMFVEATNLENFQCFNPNVCVITSPEEATESKEPWMLSKIGQNELFINVFNRTYRCDLRHVTYVQIFYEN